MIVPGMVAFVSQYRILEKNTTPNIYPTINLCFIFLFSRAKNNGINAIHAKNSKLNFGYASIKRNADIIGRANLYFIA